MFKNVSVKQFILYLLRWQASTPILYLCMAIFPFNGVVKVILANLVGGGIFFFVDKWIFGRAKKPDGQNEVEPFPQKSS